MPAPETGRRWREWTEQAWKEALWEGCPQRAGERGRGLGRGVAQGRQEEQGFHVEGSRHRHSESFSQARLVGAGLQPCVSRGTWEAFLSQGHHATHSRTHFDPHLSQALPSPWKANCCPWVPTPQAASVRSLAGSLCPLENRAPRVPDPVPRAVHVWASLRSLLRGTQWPGCTGVHLLLDIGATSSSRELHPELRGPGLSAATGCHVPGRVLRKEPCGVLRELC